MFPTLVLLGLLAQPPVTAPSKAPGRRVELAAGATLFVPEGYKAGEGETVDILLHLHGAASAAEPAVLAARWPGVLVTFNRPGLSSVYTKPFSDKALFPILIQQALDGVKSLGLADDPKAGRVVVSAFSAGFGGVREMLKVPEHFERIEGLVLADSLYAGYAGDPAEHRIDPTLIDNFKRFATEAAAGRKTMLVTHSAQVPPGYASTTETADALIAAVGGAPSRTSIDWGDGWKQSRTFAKGRFVVLGFEGTEGTDHLRHLRQIGRLWARFLDNGRVPG